MHYVNNAFSFHLKLQKIFNNPNQFFNNPNPFTGQYGAEPFNSENVHNAEAFETNDENFMDSNIENDKKYTKLVELPRQQIDNIAKKLNIYGFSEMTKEELAKKILDLTTANNEK